MKQFNISVNKKLITSLVCIVIAFLLLFFLFFQKKGYTNQGLISTTKPVLSSGEVKELAVSEGKVKIAESDVLTLFLSSENNSLQIVDKRNNYEWSTMVGDEYYKDILKNKILKRGLQQLFQINVINEKNESEIANNIVASVTVQKYSIDSGVRLYFYFDDYKIGLNVDVWLDNNAVNVSIPEKSIQEKGNYKLTSVDLLPFLGASNKEEKGYIYYPDGCGAIYKFNTNLQKSRVPYIQDVYSSSTYNLDLIKEQKEQNIKNILLPAFGVVHDKNAFVGYICNGDDSAAIRLAPNGNIYSLDRVYSSAIYRKSFTYLSPDKKEIMDTEKNRRTGNYTVRYMFTYDENGASYSNLSNEVREYLIISERLNNQIKKLEKPQMNIQFFMGTTEKTLLYESYVTMTTYKEALNILEEIGKSKIGLSSILFGWQKKGFNYNPTTSKSASSLGNEKQFFTQLKSKQISVYLNNNFVAADKDTGGYSKSEDVAQDYMGLPITNSDKDSFLISPLKIWNDFSKGYVSNFNKRNVSGLAFDIMGNTIYDDYNSKADMKRQDTMNAWNSIAAVTHNDLGRVAVQSASAYLLKYTDFIYDLPDNCSEIPLISEAIPFYQMVLHGHIPYTSTTAGNMAYDFEYQKLKWIEYGSVPFFVLTEKDTSLLKDTKSNQLFASQYSVFKERIMQLAEEYNKNMQGINNAEMISHKRTGDIVRIRYSNGKSIIINYSDTDTTVDDETVRAKNYIVKGA